MKNADKHRQRETADAAPPERSINASTGQQTLTIEKAIDIAVQHHQAGRLSDAEGIYQQILQADPNQPIALHLLGVIAHQVSKNDIAFDLITKALEFKPDYAEAYCNLGLVLQGMGKLDEAVANYRKALTITSDYAEAHYNLGNALQGLRKLDEAVASYHNALAIKTNYAEADYNLGCAYSALRRLDEATLHYRKALAVKPDYLEAHNNLGKVFREQGKPDDAITCYRKAIALNPNYAEAHGNLGNAFKDLGKFDEAVASYRQALTLKPDFFPAHCNLVFTLMYCPNVTGKTILDEARRWDQQHGYRGEIPRHRNSPDPERPLRIGYVSADFKEHAAGYLLEPLLAGHDHKAVTLICYGEVSRPDSVTKRFQDYADLWRSTVGLSDAELADLIREDGIDIIIECTGHSANNRLLALTRKPAPIMVNYFSMHGSTSGLAAMDYVLSDPVLTPPGFEDQFSEEVVLLPHGAVTFRPDPEWPAVAPRRATRDGPLFACVGDPARISADTIDLWARLLERVPGSRILFKNPRYSDDQARAVWRRAFGALGAGALFEGVDGGWKQNMDVYGRVDVVLDTLPISGALSCLIPLWMGVPVLTMVGPNNTHRFGSAMVTHAGMAEFSADHPEEYLNIASDQINDPERLAALRRTMRDTIRASHIMDVREHAASVEDALRKMWRTWCEKNAASHD